MKVAHAYNAPFFAREPVITRVAVCVAVCDVVCVAVSDAVCGAVRVTASHADKDSSRL